MMKKGQSTLEYTIIIIIVVAALLATGIYLKRAVAGRIRETSDQIGEQYEPGNTTGHITTVVERDVFTEIVTDPDPTTIVDGRPGYGTYEYEVTNRDYTLRFGTETVGP